MGAKSLACSPSELPWQHADVGENKNAGELRHLLFNPSELPLQECDRSPQQVASDREIAETIEAQIKEISRLRGQVAVLTHAKESDAKRFRTIALERHREREELNAELAKLKVGLSGHGLEAGSAAGELWCVHLRLRRAWEW